jgi:hypothetical protein
MRRFLGPECIIKSNYDTSPNMYLSIFFFSFHDVSGGTSS